jgi:ATP-dependent DNA helicase PIF1
MTTISLSPEQEYAFELFKQGKNLFITGPGGTGKSQLIKTIVNYCDSRYPKQYQVCAMTGCAAIILKMNAKTIHSWSGIKIARGSKEQIINSIYRNRKASSNWKKVRVLIIDEVSMMSQKIFEILEETARTIRKRYASPFGGIQIVFCGDFFQLPPVGNIMEPETVSFCFQSPKWPQVFPLKNIIELTHIFRQKDDTYIKILNEIRYGKISEENIEILNKYVNRKYDESETGIVPPKLFPIKSKVECYNKSMFDKINTDCKVFNCVKSTNLKTYIESGVVIDSDTLEICNNLTNEEREREIQYIIDNNPINEYLELKIGVVVMCTANIDLDNGICNGSLGIVKGFSSNNRPIIKFRTTEITMEPYNWQHNEYPSLAVSQFPLMLAWAMTIHKIQGATLPMAEIDIGKTIFEYGQIYVALSRIQSLDGLYLFGFHPIKIKANPVVIDFYNQIPKYNSNYYFNKIEEIKKINYEKDKNQELKYEEYDTSITTGIKKLDLTVFSYKEENNDSIKSEKYNDNCVVCFTNKKNLLLRPCNHLCLCSSCDNSKIINCPMCRMIIEEKIKVFN